VRTNGSIRGVRRSTSLGAAVGAWGPDDVLIARQNSLWPVPPLGSVAALYHFDSDLTSTHGGPTLVASGVTPPAVDSGSAKFGAGGLLAQTSGLLLSATSSQLVFNTQDFCVELWLKLAAYQSGGLVCLSTTGNYDVGMLYFNSGYLAWYAPTSSFDGLYDGWVGGDNTWHHVALVRHSGVMKIYLDGVKLANQANDSTNWSSAARISVCSYPDASQRISARIDELRVTTGHCVYDANFTPPTEAFSD